MRAELKGLGARSRSVDSASEPESFALTVRMIVGPLGRPGEETFDLTVCSPEWLSQPCREVGILDARHHLVVNADAFDKRELRKRLESRVHVLEADTWSGIAARLGRLGHWEFEDYKG